MTARSAGVEEPPCAQDAAEGTQARAQKRFPWFLRVFEPAPPVPPPSRDEAQIQAKWRQWRMRVLVTSILGYATFYLVRKNLGIAMPMMSRSVAEGGLGISKSDFGLFLTLHGLLYGVSKFANGFLGDRCNARTFMVAGLGVSALLNIVFGTSSSFIALGVVWMLNGWFQGMGFPPCTRLMTHWFAPRELATKMTIWNASTNIGAGLAVVLCGYLAVVNWRLCFFVPAALALIGCVGMLLVLPDTPSSVGMPEIKGTETVKRGADTEAFRSVARRLVFNNPYIWLIGAGNFFVYAVRYALLDWGPTLLTETRGIKLTDAGWIVAAFEISGMVGSILAGWISDHVFGGRSIRVCAVYMVLTAFAILGFWKIPGNSVFLNIALLCATGFFLYGPQSLVGIAAANLATKRAAATAAGFTGLFSYASTVLSGWGLAKLVEGYGWNAALAAMMILCGIGIVLFASGWKAKAHGYEETEYA